jgi:hypothetical protein
VLLEAAHLSMAVAGKHDASRPGARHPDLEETLTYLREARQRPSTQHAGDVELSLALALDRSGRPDQADVVLAEAHRRGARVSAGATYVTLAEDRLALAALATEPPDLAGKAWQAYVAAAPPGREWVTAARARAQAGQRGATRSRP